MNFYLYLCIDLFDEGSVWYDMKIDVVMVKEYFGFNCIMGMFLDIVYWIEVIMMLKFFDLNFSDEDLIKYVRRIWNFVLFFGS